MPQNLIVTEAAEHLRVSARKVYELLESGQLPGFRVGKSWRIRQEALEQFIQRNTSGQAPAA